MPTEQYTGFTSLVLPFVLVSGPKEPFFNSLLLTSSFVLFDSSAYLSGTTYIDQYIRMQRSRIVWKIRLEFCESKNINNSLFLKAL
jgi:hypothetical protein